MAFIETLKGEYGIKGFVRGGLEETAASLKHHIPARRRKTIFSEYF